MYVHEDTLCTETSALGDAGRTSIDRELWALESAWRQRLEISSLDKRKRLVRILSSTAGVWTPGMDGWGLGGELGETREGSSNQQALVGIKKK